MIATGFLVFRGKIAMRIPLVPPMAQINMVKSFDVPLLVLQSFGCRQILGLYAKQAEGRTE